jgi:isopenicillin-N epimerase
MKNSWIQRERRDGVKIKWIKIDTPPKSAQAYVDAVAAAITPRTKVIETMHLSFMTGYVAPVKQIMDIARPKGIQVFVDGAHAFAHFPFTRDELDTDYYGTSLHKWLMAPIGTGFLYVRRDKVKALWPLQAGSVEQENDIRKFEEIGTHPAANHNAIAVALAFHRSIGADRKIARLRYLRDRWAKRVIAESGGRARSLTPIGPNESGAMAVMAIDGLDIGQLRGWLLGKHRVVATAIIHEEFAGLRVTPNVYNTVEEVDRFAELMISAIKKGVTA